MLSFKNDKERIAFLEDYRNLDNGWYLWKDDEDLQRRWWRFDLTTCCLIVEEQLQTLLHPNKHQEMRLLHWYIIDDFKEPFADGVASRSMALNRLKMELKK